MAPGRDGDTSHVDDLFDKQPEPAGETAYVCPSCANQFKGPADTKFCPRCGAGLAPHDAAGQKCVLLADDSAMSRHMISAIVRQLGCRVVEAADGEAALSQARYVNPDLIVLDVKMPGKSGVEVLRALREDERFRDTPIVMLTGSGEADTVSQALSGKATDYLLKDAGADRIRERLRRHLRVS